MRILGLFFILFISLSSVAQSTINGSFVHDGLTRSYSFYVPVMYDGSQAVPLILNLHGYTSNAAEQSIYGNFKPIADTAGFIVVHPEGTVQAGTTSTQFWNIGLFGSNVDDVGFLTALIDTISAHYSIDHSRVYTTGMSNGGYMSYKLVCETTRFAAMASVTGDMTVAMRNNCNAAPPTPVMEIHGTADGTVPYGGSTGVLSIDSVMNYWAFKNGCPTPPSMSQVPDIVPTDGATAEHFVWGPGTNGVTMELFKIINGGHTWPGAPVVIGTTCMDFSASKEIWRFFNQYSNPLATINESAENSISVYPNPCEDLLMIDSNSSSIDQVILTNISGEIIPISLEDKTISLTHLPAGFYFLTITSESHLFQSKIFKNPRN
jgi:polyhydroxybutyrate depolymerase